MSPAIFFLLSDIVCWSFSRKIRERKIFYFFFFLPAVGSTATALPAKEPQPRILKTKCAFWHHRVSSACLHLTAIPPPEFLAEESEERLTFRVVAKPMFPDAGKNLASVAGRRFTETAPRGLALTYIVCKKNQMRNVFFEDFFNYFLWYSRVYIICHVFEGCGIFIEFFLTTASEAGAIERGFSVLRCWNKRTKKRSP